MYVHIVTATTLQKKAISSIHLEYLWECVQLFRPSIPLQVQLHM